MNRRAFTLTLVPLILWITLVILGIILASRAPAAATTTSSAYNAGKAAGAQYGPLIVAILFGGFMVLMASPWAEKKGHVSANILFGLILGVANIAFLVNALGLAGKPMSKAEKNERIARLITGQPAPATENPAADLARRSIEDFNKGQEALRRLREPTNPAPAPTHPPSSTPPQPFPSAPSQPQQPATPQTPPSPPTARPPLPPPIKPVQSAQVTKALDDLRASVNTQVSEALTPLEPLRKTIAKTPRTNLVEIRKRLDDLDASREKLKTLSKRFNDLITEATSAAEKAGDDNAMATSITFSHELDASSRGFAADSILRTLDHARNEAEILRANFGKWSLDKDGKVTSKDFKIQADARSARFFLDVDLKSIQSKIDEVRK